MLCMTPPPGVRARSQIFEYTVEMKKRSVGSLVKEDRPCRPWRTTRWCDAQPVKQTGARVEGLLPCCEYCDIRVVAHNIVGHGEPSLPVPSLTTHAIGHAGPVLNLSVSDISPSAFRLSWMPPWDTGIIAWRGRGHARSRASRRRRVPNRILWRVVHKDA